MGERIDRPITKLVNDTRLQRLTKSALYRSDTVLTQENGDHEIIEVEMDAHKVVDDKPIIMAVTILQNSKLLFLKFVYEVLHKYIQRDSIKLNYADTDSLCICKLTNL